MNFRPRRFLLAIAFACAVSLLLASSSQAQSISVANPSFEIDQFTVGPGMAAGNGGAITGWSFTGGGGINPLVGGVAPFLANGIIPDGAQTAIMQGTGTLSQTLSGLDTSKQYWLQFYVEARDCCGGTANGTVSFAGTNLFGGASLPITPNEAAGSFSMTYPFLNVPFTPTASSGDLVFTVGTEVAGDHTIFFDAVSVIQRDADEIVIQNPSFEASGDVVSPGYTTASRIAGWEFTNLGGGNPGINSAAGPFQDNGAIPDGTHVALLQQPGELSQLIDGLTPGQDYFLQFDYNARTGSPPYLQVEMDGNLVFEDLAVAAVDAVGGTNPFLRAKVSFTAAASAETLLFRQVLPFPTTDQTVLLDNVSIRPVPEPSTAMLAIFGLLGWGAAASRRRNGRASA